MAKKYIAPAMKVIYVEKNIIATSGPGWSNNSIDAGSALIRGIEDFDDEF